MGALKVKLAERKIVEHLQLGGEINDTIGKELVQAFTQKVFQEANIRKICDENKFTPAEVESIIYFMTQELMPKPAINSGGLLLVTTLMFMEVQRLEELFVRINHKVENDTALSDDPITNKMMYIASESKETAKIVWDTHAMHRGEQPFPIQNVGGLKTASGGCASMLILGSGTIFLVERIINTLIL